MHEQQTELFKENKASYMRWDIYDGSQSADKLRCVTFEPQNLALIVQGVNLMVTPFEEGTHKQIGDPIIVCGMTYRWSTHQVLERLKQVNRMCEIGVSFGNNAWRMCNKLKPKECHLVDPYEMTPENVIDEASKKPAEFPYMIARHILQNFPVMFHKLPASEASVTFDDDYFDFIYVDGDHSFEACKDDIELWLPKLRKGGIMAGDDYHKDGVKPAVESVFGDKHEVSPNGYEWLVVKE